MKKLLIAATMAASVGFGAANATVIDFQEDGDLVAERGVLPGDVVTINGVNMSIFANVGVDEGFGYIDGNDSGLGVCGNLDVNLRCDPSADAAVQADEGVFVFFNDFEFGVRLADIVFRDTAQGFLGQGGADGLVTITTFTDTGINVMTDLFSTFVALSQGGDSFFANVLGVGFEFVDTAFYVDEFAAVPVPAALPLFLSGLAGMGVAARRRKKAVA